MQKCVKTTLFNIIYLIELLAHLCACVCVCSFLEFPAAQLQRDEQRYDTLPKVAPQQQLQGILHSCGGWRPSARNPVPAAGVCGCVRERESVSVSMSDRPCVWWERERECVSVCERVRVCACRVCVCVCLGGDFYSLTHLFFTLKQNIQLRDDWSKDYFVVFPLAKVGLGDVSKTIITIFSVNIDNCHNKCHLYSFKFKARFSAPKWTLWKPDHKFSLTK